MLSTRQTANMAKVEAFLAKHYENEINVAPDCVLRNVYRSVIPGEDDSEAWENAGQDIEFVYKGVILRRMPPKEDFAPDEFGCHQTVKSRSAAEKITDAFDTLDNFLRSLDLDNWGEYTHKQEVMTLAEVLGSRHEQ